MKNAICACGAIAYGLLGECLKCRHERYSKNRKQCSCGGVALAGRKLCSKCNYERRRIMQWSHCNGKPPPLESRAKKLPPIEKFNESPFRDFLDREHFEKIINKGIEVEGRG